jgi:hypothetical protein
MAFAWTYERAAGSAATVPAAHAARWHGRARRRAKRAGRCHARAVAVSCGPRGPKPAGARVFAAAGRVVRAAAGRDSVAVPAGSDVPGHGAGQAAARLAFAVTRRGAIAVSRAAWAELAALLRAAARGAVRSASISAGGSGPGAIAVCRVIPTARRIFRAHALPICASLAGDGDDPGGSAVGRTARPAGVAAAANETTKIFVHGMSGARSSGAVAMFFMFLRGASLFSAVCA